MENSSTDRRTLPCAARSASSNSPAATAEEIVANKLNQFVRSRREIVPAMAAALTSQCRADVERFFDLAEAGQLNEMEALYDSLKQRWMADQDFNPDLAKLWPAPRTTGTIVPSTTALPRFRTVLN